MNARAQTEAKANTKEKTIGKESVLFEFLIKKHLFDLIKEKTRFFTDIGWIVDTLLVLNHLSDFSSADSKSESRSKLRRKFYSSVKTGGHPDERFERILELMFYESMTAGTKGPPAFFDVSPRIEEGKTQKTTEKKRESSAGDLEFIVSNVPKDLWEGIFSDLPDMKTFLMAGFVNKQWSRIVKGVVANRYPYLISKSDRFALGFAEEMPERVTKLDVSFRDEISDETISKFTDLVELELRGNESITDAGISNLTDLRYLGYGKKTKDFGALKGLTKLSELSVIDDDFAMATTRFDFDALSTNLTELRMALTSFPVSFGRTPRIFENLRVFEENVKIDALLPTLSHETFPSLTSLRIRNAGWTTEKMSTLTNLTLLRLDPKCGHIIGNHDELKGMTNLKTLSLNIDERDATRDRLKKDAFSDLVGLVDLRAKNRSRLGSLEKSKALRFLNARNADVSHVRFDKLKTLYVGGKDVPSNSTDRFDANAFSSLTELHLLDSRWTRFFTKSIEKTEFGNLTHLDMKFKPYHLKILEKLGENLGTLGFTDTEDARWDDEIIRDAFLRLTRLESLTIRESFYGMWQKDGASEALVRISKNLKRFFFEGIKGVDEGDLPEGAVNDSSLKEMINLTTLELVGCRGSSPLSISKLTNLTSLKWLPSNDAKKTKRTMSDQDDFSLGYYAPLSSLVDLTRLSLPTPKASAREIHEEKVTLSKALYKLRGADAKRLAASIPS